MRPVRIMSAAVIAMALIALAGCVPGSRIADDDPQQVVVTAPPAPAPSAPAPTPTAQDVITFQAVIDGDTIETSAGTVRIIGIDTPERGQCGHDEASMAIGRLLARGDAVTLELPPGQNDVDNHGRLLRFVVTADGVDLGLLQLEQGNAIARYDSTDGYPRHPHEAAYHAAQIASRAPDGTVVTLACRQTQTPTPVPTPTPTPTPTTAPSTQDEWWKQYSSCSKLKKNTVGHPTGPFDRDNPAHAKIYDWFQYGTGHSGDGDNDGLACE